MPITLEEAKTELRRREATRELAARTTPPEDTWDYVFSRGGSLADVLPITERTTYDAMLEEVRNPKDFEDQFTSSLYMSSVAGIPPDLAWDANQQFSTYFFNEQMTPSQIVSRATQDHELVKRYTNAWNSLVSSIEKEPMPTRWDEAVNRTASSLARMASSGASAMAFLSTRPIGTPFGPTPEVTQADREYAEIMKEKGRFLWEVGKNPDLALRRDDWLSQITAMGVETIPYITATTVGVLAGGPLGGFSVAWMVEGNSAYQTALDEGVSEDIAQMIGMGVGVVSGAVEAFGGRAADKLMKSATDKIKSKLLKAGANLTVGSMTEALEEAGQEIAALTGESIYRDVNWDEAVKRTLVAAGGGALLGGIFKTASAAIRGITAESPKSQQIRLLRFAAAQGQLTDHLVKTLEEEAETVVAEAEKAAEAPAVPPEAAVPAVTPAKEVVAPEPTEAAPKGEIQQVEAAVESPIGKEDVALEDLEGTPVPVNKDGTITLYHRTSAENAEKIKATGEFISEERGEVFFSTIEKGQAEGFGDAIIAIKIDPSKASLDDAFSGGEVHVSVNNKDISLENIITPTPVQPPAKAVEAKEPTTLKEDVTGILGGLPQEPAGLTKAEVEHLGKREQSALRAAQERGLKVGYKQGVAATIKDARRSMAALITKKKLTEQNRMDLASIVLTHVPKEFQGRYVRRVLNVKTPKAIKKLAETIQEFVVKKDIEVRKRKAARIISKPIPESVEFFYREAIEALRGGVDPAMRQERTLISRERTREFLARKPEALKDMPTKLMKKLSQKSLGELTVDELEEVAAAIDKLVEQGKLKRKLKLAQQQRRLTEKTTAMVSNITKGEPIDVDVTPVVLSTSRQGLVSTAFEKTKAWTWRPARIFDMLDGRKEFSGPNHRFFIDETNRKTDEKWRQTDRRLDAGKSKQKDLGISTRDLSQTRVVNDVRYTVDEMIDIYAKNKNRLAKLAIMYGNNLTESDIDDIIGALTDSEKAWGDAIIEDYDQNYNRLRREVIEVEDRDLGAEENYTPIRRTDIDYSTHTKEVVDAILQRSTLRKAYAEKGFTISRKEVPAEFQKPIRLGITRMWFEQVKKQEEYIALAQHIRDMHRVRNDNDFKTAVTQRFGREFNKVIEGYVNRVANPNVYRSFNSLENLSRRMRQNAAVAYLSYNVVTMAKQLPSIFLYLQDAGFTHLISSAVEFASNPMKMVENVRNLDPQVKHKAIERELEELRQRQGSVTTQLIARFGDAGMEGIYLIDSVARTIGWNAVYNKALDAGKSEAEAVRMAQNATLRTQPAAAPKDLPQLYATSEFANWFTMFTNQLNQIFNIATYDIPSYLQNKKYGNAALATTGMSITALAIWSLAHRKVPEEPEEFLEAATEQAINAVPLLGKSIMASKRGWGSSDIPAFELGKAAGKAIAAVERREFTDNDLKVIAEAIAVSIGMPFIGPKRVLKAVKTGEAGALLGGKSQPKRQKIGE